MQTKDFSELACVVMASGLGTRFGSNKLLAQLEGKALIERTLDALLQAGINSIVVVTRSKEVRKIAQGFICPTILHQLPYQSDTVALGVKYWQAHKSGIKGLLFSTGDQPLLKPSTIQQLCQAYLQSYKEPPAAQIYRLAQLQDKQLVPGNPVIFSPELWPELLQLPQDKGGSTLCKKYPEIVHTITATPNELLDIDTREDLQKIIALLKQ